MFINCFMLAGFLLFVRSDSIMFCLSKDKDEEAIAAIEKVYHDSEDKGRIL